MNNENDKKLPSNIMQLYNYTMIQLFNGTMVQ